MAPHNGHVDMVQALEPQSLLIHPHMDEALVVYCQVYSKSLPLAPPFYSSYSGVGLSGYIAKVVSRFTRQSSINTMRDYCLFQLYWYWNHLASFPGPLLERILCVTFDPHGLGEQRAWAPK